MHFMCNVKIFLLSLTDLDIFKKNGSKSAEFFFDAYISQNVRLGNIRK